MKILLVGPQPPPHGGVSVHVAGIHRVFTEAGVPCRVLDTGRGCLRFSFMLNLLRYVAGGWTIHLHTNGHNVKSWILGLGCGMAGQFGRPSTITLHSGMAPGYLQRGPFWKRQLAASVCSLHSRVVCVSPEIREAILSLRVKEAKTEVAPASTHLERNKAALNPLLLAWMDRHRPLLSATVFFRPEYGIHLLVTLLARLRQSNRSVGCVVMGSGEQRAEAERLVRLACLQDNVLMTGDLNHDMCLAVMSRSDLFLRPTLADGDSTSVREALSLGVPVVASRVGARPPGAILFRTGDDRDFLAKVKQALYLPQEDE